MKPKPVMRQDWPRDLAIQFIERNKEDLVLDNHIPVTLNSKFAKAGNPLSCLQAEDEIYSLVFRSLFWSFHPIFSDVLNSAEPLLVVQGKPGTGRTAFCWGLYTHEGYQGNRQFLVQVSREMWLKLPQVIAREIWQYVCFKPTFLDRLSKDECNLLVLRLGQTLAKATMLEDLLQTKADLSWVRKAAVEDSSEIRKLGLQQLNRLENKLKRLPTTRMVIPDEAKWIASIRGLLGKLTNGNFRTFRILLDYQSGDTVLHNTLRSRLGEWLDWELQVVAIMSTQAYEIHFDENFRFPMYELKWSKDDLEKMVRHRFVQQLKSQASDGHPAPVSRARSLLNQFFEHGGSVDMWLDAGQTPREIIAVWQGILRLHSREEALISEELVQQAIRKVRDEQP